MYSIFMNRKFCEIYVVLDRMQHMKPNVLLFLSGYFCSWFRKFKVLDWYTIYSKLITLYCLQNLSFHEFTDFRSVLYFHILYSVSTELLFRFGIHFTE